MLAKLRRFACLLFLSFVALLLVGSMWEEWSRSQADRRFQPIGSMVEVDGSSFHLNCIGEGTPVVLLEAGLTPMASLTWTMTQEALVGYTRVCSYDRAGLLWSERRIQGRSAYQLVDELHALLRAADLSPPFVMVGHSLGGILTRVYDARYPGEVAGFVFVDSSHPEQQHRLPPTASTSVGPPAPIAWLATRTGILRLVTHRRARNIELPHEQALVAHLPQSTLASMAEGAALDSTAAQGARTGSLGERPIVVLTAGSPEDEPPAGSRGELHRAALIVRTALQEELAALSTNSDHRFVPGASHTIQMDAPDVTALAIRDVVDAVRSDSAVVAR